MKMMLDNDQLLAKVKKQIAKFDTIDIMPQY